jgi:hypothetical protein
MRPWLAWLPLVMFGWGCSGGMDMPSAPTAHAVMLPPGANAAPWSPDVRNWSPFYFPAWQVGIGEVLTPGTTVSSTVIAGDVCVSHLRTAWDARASCRRFTIDAPAQGKLEAFLNWDASAPGFNPTLVGDVVFIAPSGQFNASPGASADEYNWALVDPGSYGVLVMSYVDATLPFQLRMELTPIK